MISTKVLCVLYSVVCYRKLVTKVRHIFIKQSATLSSGQMDLQVHASLQINQNLRTDLRWVAKRIRKSARKFTQVAKSRKFHAYTVDLRSTCVDLRWVAKR